MKVAVINIRTIIKCMFIFFIVFSLLLFIIGLKNLISRTDFQEKNISFLEFLKYEIPMFNIFDKEDKKIQTMSVGIRILSTEMGLLNNTIENNIIISNNSSTNFIENNYEEDANIGNEILEIDNTNNMDNQIEVEVVNENNINPTYTNEYNGIRINNQTSYNIEDLIQNSTYTFKSKNVIIYHTHTCESYTPTENNYYNMTDSYRTTDCNYSVVRVGNELKNELEKYNFSVIHNTTYHDYPSYNGSYGRSLKTLEDILSDGKSTQIVIDLHRDAVGSDMNYAPRVKINDDICAQVMFVIGTDGSGLYHPDWRENLKSAIEIQRVANEMYPGLFRPIILRNARYNQQLTTASSIIEVGATGNTLEECISSMKYIAQIFNELKFNN